MCVCVCLYVEPVSRAKDLVRSHIKIGYVACMCTPVSQCIYIPLGASFFFFFFEPVWPSGKAIGLDRRTSV